MRKKAPVLLLVIFALFLGIAIFHPFSHGLHHEHDDGHDCPVCLWLHYAAVIFFFAVDFYVIFRVISYILVLPGISPASVSFSSDIPRAPPKHYFSAV
ncbi:MAG: hypothetical protein PHE18_08525 [Candidatus Omnitrophica bacterium]|jgi:hypothetical protein|nr:hypothetical protein [Candidatus Omnitrophota bacterium]